MAMTLNFEYDVDIKPRYRPEPHQALFDLLQQRRALYVAHLRRFRELAGYFAEIPITTEDPETPFWSNPFFSGLDAIALTGMLVTLNPRRYIEVGSGNSTKFARRAIASHALGTHVTSIDREPRAEIDSLCDEVVRVPIEQMDLSIFDRLESGDILFIDGSHQVLTNSDTTVAFLEVLPRVKPGVWVHLHDVFLPWDYPEEWTDRHYAEQYVLACALLLDAARIEVEFPDYFVCRDQELLDILSPIHDRLPTVQRHGGSFWLRKR
jgi:hypothetical protein